jgi:tryptophan synthase alpha chain
VKPTRLADVFARARAERRAALIGYLPAGFPSRERSVELLQAMVASGVDAVEVGLPYSDPLMDGPVIQEAVEIALRAGTTTQDVLAVVGEVSGTGAATMVMSYWNPIEQFGAARFAEGLAEAGGTGVITPDLTPEESDEWVRSTDECGIDRVFLVAPSSTGRRIEQVASACTGFVYAASTMGVTGARAALGSRAQELVARVKERTELPVAVGVGVSTGEQAAQVASFADGVIVGSAFIARVLDDPRRANESVAELARELAAGVRA